MLFLEETEVWALGYAVAPHYRTLVLTAAYTGMRFGELAALRVECVDILKRKVTVAASVADVGGELHYGPTKSKRVRTIAVPPFLAALLSDQVVGKERSDLLFTDKLGEATRNARVNQKHFKPAVRAALVPEKQKLRFHDLRHTCAALLIAQGEYPKAIANRLGHSSIAITMDLYGHLYEDHEAEMMERMEESAAEAQAAQAKVLRLKRSGGRHG